MCACTCVVTQHMSSNTQNKPSQADLGIGRKEGSGEKSRKGDGKYSMISVKNIICNISREIKDFTKTMITHSFQFLMILKFIYISDQSLKQLSPNFSDCKLFLFMHLVLPCFPSL